MNILRVNLDTDLKVEPCDTLNQKCLTYWGLNDPYLLRIFRLIVHPKEHVLTSCLALC